MDTIEQINEQIKNLCPWDDHNEILALESLKSKLQKQILNAFNI